MARREAVTGFPAGPGLSAVDMAAACLCLAYDVGSVDAPDPVAVDRNAGVDHGAVSARPARAVRAGPQLCRLGHRGLGVRYGADEHA